MIWSSIVVRWYGVQQWWYGGMEFNSGMEFHSGMKFNSGKVVWSAAMILKISEMQKGHS